MKNHIKLYEDFFSDPNSPRYATYDQVSKWLDSMGIKNYTINDDLTVDVDGDVDLSDKLEWAYFHVKFNTVKNGSFVCSNNHFQSLQGCPITVTESFICHSNRLTSLKGAPIKVGDNFECGGNQLDSLEGVPKEVGGNFGCYANNLTSLVFAPKEPWNYNNNPCTRTYYKLGFTPEGHYEALKKYDPNPLETLRRLKDVYPDRFEDILKLSKEWRLEFGMESKELTDAYNTSKDVEGDFY